MPTGYEKTCIVLICDLNYLLYTLVCADQAKAHAPDGIGLRIYLDAKPEFADLAQAVEKRTGIQIRLVPEAVLAEITAIRPHTEHFNHSHLSRSALLRLKIADLIGNEYERVLYLDGDIQVRRSLKPLFDIVLTPGKFLAVRDWKAHQSFEGMPESAEEQVKLSALGLPQAKWGRYFNTGMMLGDMKAWREIGPLALDFYKAHPEVCHTYDQCALNAVASDRVVLVSARWNYLRAFMTLPVFSEIDPAIIHFAAPPKPWNGPMRPWGQAVYAAYGRMDRKLKDLNLSWRKLPLWRQIKWNLREILKPGFANPAYRERIQALLRQDEPL